MKNLIVLVILLVSGFSFGQTVPVKAPVSKPATDCNCIYPLKANVDKINYCVGPKGGLYCINSKGNKTYKSSIK